MANDLNNLLTGVSLSNCLYLNSNDEITDSDSDTLEKAIKNKTGSTNVNICAGARISPANLARLFNAVGNKLTVLYCEQGVSDELAEPVIALIANSTNITHASLTLSWTEAHILALADALYGKRQLSNLSFTNTLGVLSDKALLRLLDSWDTLPAANSINFSGNRLSANALGYIGERFKSRSKYREIYLVGCRLKDDDLTKLLEKLGGGDQLIGLSLINNELTDRSVPGLLALILNNPKLSALFLSNTHLTPAGVGQLLNSLRNRATFFTLDLRGVLLSCDLIKECYQTVNANKLLCLSLNYHNSNYYFHSSLSPASLNELNSELGESDRQLAIYIGDSALRDNTLDEFTVQQALTTSGLERMAESLMQAEAKHRENFKLRKLNIRINGDGATPGITSLIRFLHSNRSLAELILNQLELRDNLSVSLFATLKQHRGLIKLSLNLRTLSGHGELFIEALADYLEANPALEYLNIHYDGYNYLSPQHMQRLEQALSQNFYLKQFTLTCSVAYADQAALKKLNALIVLDSKPSERLRAHQLYSHLHKAEQARYLGDWEEVQIALDAVFKQDALNRQGLRLQAEVSEQQALSHILAQDPERQALSGQDSLIHQQLSDTTQPVDFCLGGAVTGADNFYDALAQAQWC